MEARCGPVWVRIREDRSGDGATDTPDAPAKAINRATKQRKSCNRVRPCRLRGHFLWDAVASERRIADESLWQLLTDESARRVGPRAPPTVYFPQYGAIDGNDGNTVVVDAAGLLGVVLRGHQPCSAVAESGGRISRTTPMERENLPTIKQNEPNLQFLNAIHVWNAESTRTRPWRNGFRKQELEQGRRQQGQRESQQQKREIITE